MSSNAEQIAVDEGGLSSDESDNSDYVSGSEYSTETLSSSIYDYRFENGRRYHAYKDGQYSLPNDEREQNRLDIMHHVYLLMLDDELHLAPIGKSPQRILDVGTGTGIWAIDMAERYPSAQVIGTDLSPIQPSWVPPNVSFQVDDAEGDWTWEPASFDFIHIRHLTGAIKDWGHLIEQAFTFLKPGGWVEIAEYDMNLFSDDGSYHRDTWLWKFYGLVNKASEQTGREFKALSSIEPLLQKAGFEGINYQMFKLPVGTWPADPKQKEKGAYMLLNAETAFEAVGMALMTRELGMPLDEVERILIGVQTDCKSRKIHTYSKQHLYFAQKACE